MDAQTARLLAIKILFASGKKVNFFASPLSVAQMIVGGQAAMFLKSKGLAERLFRLQRGKCACCKKPLGSDYHLDHIMPLALGGVNEDSNIQLLRAKCNMQKHTVHPVEFMQQRGFLL